MARALHRLFQMRHRGCILTVLQMGIPQKAQGRHDGQRVGGAVESALTRLDCDLSVTAHGMESAG
jgi:hypothetical protein